MTKPIIITAGIDTSKDKLDIAVYGERTAFKVDNKEPGWRFLAEKLTQAGVRRIGIEATGGYERGVTRHLQAQGFTVVVMQPLQVKAFAKLHLRRAKTDRIDASLIAACAHTIDAKNKMEPDPRFDTLTDHLTYIEQIEEDMTRWKTRIEHIADERVRTIVAADLKTLRKRRTDEIKALIEALCQYADLAERFELVLSIPGYGKRTALAAILRMPELGNVTREQAAALAGLAPFVHESGVQKGQTHIAGGRERLRRALYAAALPASFRWNPALIATYKRLIANGKTHKSALVACARKLIIYANTVLQRGTPWIKTKIEA